MKPRIVLGLVVCMTVGLSIASPAFAAPEFLAYEGRNAIHDGQGGEKKTVDGIDFWSNGDPPRRFKVLGSLTDRRHKTGIIGMVRMSGLDGDIAKAAKEAGGDAVILDEAHDDTVGIGAMSNTSVNGYGGYNAYHANAFSSGFAAPIMKHQSRYIVVKYLADDASAAVPAPAAAVAPASPQTAPR